MIIAVSLGLITLCVSSLAAPQDYRTTPVPILKQINRHNDDGSYSYGYESADGTFKIETKYPTGEVYGKYGYIGENGKIMEVEYGASKRGFEPKGSHINVAPPTLSNSIDETEADYDDGQYREDPSIYLKKSGASQNVFSGSGFKTTFQTPQTQRYQPQYYYQPKFEQPRFEQPRFEQPRFEQPRFYQPQPQYFIPQRHYSPIITYDPAIFNGHPATNFDINTGSYTISYSSG